MTRVLVLGAGGRIAQIVVRELLHDESVNLTLYLRNDQRLHDLPDLRATAVEGDVLNGSLLKQAVEDRTSSMPTLAVKISWTKRVGSSLRLRALACEGSFGSRR